MLGQVYGPGGSKYQVTKKINASYHQIKSLIQSTFSGTKDTDVSLFFIATHGDSDGDGDLILSGNSSVSSLPFSTLAAWLGTYVKGEVIVIIESCGAGSAIYAGRDEENSTKAADTDNSGKIASAAVRAFSAADPGILESNSTGDLRKPKYYVLAAARHRELSWGNAEFNYFTKWLVDGVGKAGNSKADSNKNGQVTLTELFNYIHKVGDSYPFEDRGRIYHQHVQRYPVGSQYNLFLLK